MSVLLLVLYSWPIKAAVPLLDHAFSQRTPLRVYIDVGHGGKDRGARGLFGIQESDLCLTIGKQVVAALEKKRLDRPMEIQLSRDQDEFLSLRERSKIANNWNADLFISIHANSSPSPIAHGFEVYFLSPDASDERARNLARSENQGDNQAQVNSAVLSILSDAQTTHHIKESSDFAETIFQALAREITPNVHGVRQAPFSVLAGTQMPAVLVEVGYVNHQIDAAHLTKQSYLKRLASAISTGIIQFFQHSSTL